MRHFLLRVIASTIVRRLVYVALGVLMAWLSSIGNAHAATFPSSSPARCLSTGGAPNLSCAIGVTGTPVPGTYSICGKTFNYSISAGAPSYWVVYISPNSPGGCGDCPANSTRSGSSGSYVCTPNTGYSAVKTGTGNAQADWSVVASGTEAAACTAIGKIYNPDTGTCGFPPEGTAQEQLDANGCAPGQLYWRGLGCSSPTGQPDTWILDPIIVGKTCDQEMCAPGEGSESAAIIGWGDYDPHTEEDLYCPYVVNASGQILGRSAEDPDCAGMPDIVSGDTTFSVTFDDDDTETKIETDTATNTGKVTTKSPTNNKTATKEEAFDFSAPASNGNRYKTGQSSSIYPGTGSQQSGTPATPVQVIGGSTGSGGEGEGDGDCASCSKETTQQQVLDALTNTPGTGSADYDGAAESILDGVSENIGSEKADGLKSVTFNKTPVCPTMTMTIPWFDKTVTMDSHCTIIAGKETLIRSLSNIGWVFLAIMIVLGA